MNRLACQRRDLVANATVALTCHRPHQIAGAATKNPRWRLGARLHALLHGGQHPLRKCHCRGHASSRKRSRTTTLSARKGKNSLPHRRFRVHPISKLSFASLGSNSIEPVVEESYFADVHHFQKNLLSTQVAGIRSAIARSHFRCRTRRTPKPPSMPPRTRKTA